MLGQCARPTRADPHGAAHSGLLYQRLTNPTKAVTLDLDDAANTVRGHQQLLPFTELCDGALLSADPPPRRRGRPLCGHHLLPGQDADSSEVARICAIV